MVNSDMTEEEDLSHLIKSVSDDDFHPFVAKKPGSVSEFSAAWKFLEVQWSRLSHWYIPRLPSAAWYHVSTPRDDLFLIILMRNVLHQQLLVLLPQ